jgi:RHS repeat-associated protein
MGLGQLKNSLHLHRRRIIACSIAVVFVTAVLYGQWPHKTANRLVGKPAETQQLEKETTVVSPQLQNSPDSGALSSADMTLSSSTTRQLSAAKPPQKDTSTNSEVAAQTSAQRDSSYVQIDAVQPSLVEMDLSRPPSHEMLIASGQLGGILSPTKPVKKQGKMAFLNRLNPWAKSDAPERMAFGEAIQNWNRHQYKKAYQQFDQFSKAYPDSPWKSEAILHMSCEARFNGRYTEAEKLFKQVITENQDNAFEGAQMMRAKAISRLAVLRVMENNPQAAQKLFGELKEIAPDWRLRTYASQWLRRLNDQQESDQQQHMANLLSCGTQALAAILTRDGRSMEAEQLLNIKPGSQGFSIDQLTTMASKHGYDARAVNLSITDIQPSQLPMILQVSRSASGGSGHYWVLEDIAKDGTVVVYDPQMSRRFTQTKTELAREWQGNAIAFTETAGRLLAVTEKQQIFGGCCGVQTPEGGLGRPDGDLGQPDSPGNDGGGLPNSPDDGQPGMPPDADPPDDPPNCPRGAPVWRVNKKNLNLYVRDIPLWYQPALGPEVKIDLSYNSQSAIAQNEPFGAKWMFNYAGYLVIDPGNTVTIFAGDGRRDTYTPLYETSPTGARVISGFRAEDGRTDRLVQINDNHYELHFDNGAKTLYQVPANTAALQLFVTQIIDAHGNALTFDYDQQARMQGIIDAQGQRTTLTYNADNLITRVEDPFGRNAAFTYDDQRNLISITDMQGYTAKLGYDHDRYITYIEDAKGRTSFDIEPADSGRWTNGYPLPGGPMSANYRITIINPNGDKQEYHYDALRGRSWYVAANDYIEYSSSRNNSYSSVPKTIYNFERVGGRLSRISSITYPNGATVNYQYDSNDRIIQQTNQFGQTQRFTYNDKGQRLTATNALGEVTTYTYQPNGLDIRTITGPRGTLNFEYNDHRQLIQSDAADGRVSQFTYLPNGKLSTVTNALNQVTQYHYNSDHRLQRLSVAGKTIATYEYDAIGRKIAQTDLHGRRTTYAYNNLDTLVEITYPGGRKTTRDYNTCPRLLHSETLPGGRRYDYRYDAAKQLVATTDPEQGQLTLERDKNGNLAALVDKNQNRTSFTYNSANQQTAQTYADDKALTTTYDRGRITTLTNARGMVTTYSYNNNQQLSAISYSDNSPGVSFSYNDQGQLQQVIDAIGTHNYSYDARGRLQSYDSPWREDIIQYSYDLLGRTSALTLNGQPYASYQYDVLGRLIQVSGLGDSFNWQYNDNHQQPSVILAQPNGITRTTLVDAAGDISERRYSNSSGIPLMYQYSYDTAGNLTSERSNRNLPAIAEEQLIAQYNPLNQLVTQQDLDNPLVYDDDGNLTQGYLKDKTPFTASYDINNQLTSISFTRNGIQYEELFSYFYTGMLATYEQKQNGTRTHYKQFLRLGTIELQERNAQDQVVAENLWNPTAPGGISGLLVRKVADNKQYFHYDHIGNLVQTVNASGEVTGDLFYIPYGEPIGGTMDQIDQHQPFGFSTKRSDFASGLVYFGYRFYVPYMERWLNRDPIGTDGGLNIYGYVENNPLIYVDPDGLRRTIRNPLREREFWENLATITDHASRAMYSADCVWVCPNQNKGLSCTAKDLDGDGFDTMTGPFFDSGSGSSGCYCQKQFPTMQNFLHPPNYNDILNRQRQASGN